MSDPNKYDCPADPKVHCGLVPQLKPVIADMCRIARNDALEEAALIAEGQAESDRWASVDFEVDATFCCEQVAERIRALKDKQP